MSQDGNRPWGAGVLPGHHWCCQSSGLAVSAPRPSQAGWTAGLWARERPDGCQGQCRFRPGCAGFVGGPRPVSLPLVPTSWRKMQTIFSGKVGALGGSLGRGQCRPQRAVSKARVPATSCAVSPALSQVLPLSPVEPPGSEAGLEQEHRLPAGLPTACSRGHRPAGCGLRPSARPPSASLPFLDRAGLEPTAGLSAG